PGVFAIDLLLSCDRPNVAAALVVERDGAAIELERPSGQVDDRAEHPVEVERRGDLATDLEQQREVASALVGGVELRVPQRDGGTDRQSFEELPVPEVEN